MPGHRLAVYLVAIALAATGLAWIILDGNLPALPSFNDPQRLRHMLLVAHGVAAALGALLLGSLYPHHMRRAWRHGFNRPSGAVMAGTALGLMATGLLLYYAGDEALRETASLAHQWGGALACVLLPVHVTLGRRTRRATP
ncbi:MAG TPA: hypothetical protein VF104_08215 [Burkholderiales bacterium]